MWNLKEYGPAPAPPYSPTPHCAHCPPHPKTPLVRLHSSVQNVPHSGSDMWNNRKATDALLCSVFSSVKGKQKQELLSGRKLKLFLHPPPPSSAVRFVSSSLSSRTDFLSVPWLLCSSCLSLFFLSLFSKQGHTCLFVLHWCFFFCFFFGSFWIQDTRPNGIVCVSERRQVEVVSRGHLTVWVSFILCHTSLFLYTRFLCVRWLYLTAAATPPRFKQWYWHRWGRVWMKTHPGVPALASWL